jgi:PqqD family protein of HPr-rel-A system
LKGAAETSDHWQIDRPEDLLWERFEDGAAVYHRRSGKTHFLNAGSVALLHRLGFGPLDRAAAAAAAAGCPVDELTPEFIAEVEETLMRFERAGLIRRCG